MLQMLQMPQWRLSAGRGPLPRKDGPVSPTAAVTSTYQASRAPTPMM